MEPGFLNKKPAKSKKETNTEPPPAVAISEDSLDQTNDTTLNDSSAIPTPRRNTSHAVAFGRTYFHALGGTTATLRQETELQYEWDVPPWASTKSAADPSARPRHKLITLRSGRPSTDNNHKTPADATDAQTNEEEEANPETYIVQAVATAQSTLFLTKSGQVFQTGTLHGLVRSHPTALSIPLPIPCVELAAGRHFCLGRMQGGIAVCSWGAGHFGQLGIGHSPNTGSGFDDDLEGPPQPITFTARPILMERLLPGAIGSTVVQIAAGDWHGMALTASGMVWAWGSNRSQQCGRKHKSSSRSSSSDETPTLVVPAPVPLDVDICQIAAGRSHSLALTKVSQQVYSWGSSIHGQCGNAVRRSPQPPRLVEGMRDLNISKIAAGGHHSLALTMGGRLFAWGQQTEGQLGLGPAYLAQPKPRLVAELDFVAIVAGQEWRAQQKVTEENNDGKISNNDNNNNDNNTEISSQSSFDSPLKNIPRIVDMYVGPSYSVAISSSGHAYCFGSNDAKQLGVATPTSLPLRDNTLPTAAMANSVMMSTQGEPTKPSSTTNPTRATGDVHVQTFDSRHNVLLPTRLDALVDTMFIRTVACGPNHLWFIGDELTLEEASDPAIHPVGYTLHEAQSGFVRPPFQERKVIRLPPVENVAAAAATTSVGAATTGDATDSKGPMEPKLDPPVSPTRTQPTNNVAVVSAVASAKNSEQDEEEEDNSTSHNDDSQPTNTKIEASSPKSRPRSAIGRFSLKIRKRLAPGSKK